MDESIIERLRAIAKTMSQTQVAKTLGVSVARVRKLAKLNNINLRSRRESRLAYNRLHPDHMKQMQMMARTSESKAKRFKTNATVESKQKRSESQKKRWQRPGEKERMSAIHKQSFADRTVDPDVKAERLRLQHVRLGAKRRKIVSQRANNRRLDDEKRRLKKLVSVPLWVPESMVDHYLEVAAERCEEDAASEIRRMKREQLGVKQ